MPVDLLAFLVVVTVLTVTPGADTVLVVSHAVHAGRPAALACALGINSGLVVWATGAVLGVSGALAAAPSAYRAVVVAGAAYLVWTGVQSLRRTRAARPGGLPGPTPVETQAATTTAFRRGVVTNLLNPKVGLFYVAVLPQLAGPGSGTTLLLALLAAVHVALSVVWLTGLACAASRATGLLSERALRRAEGAAALLLLALGVRVAASAL